MPAQSRQAAYARWVPAPALTPAAQRRSLVRRDRDVAVAIKRPLPARRWSADRTATSKAQVRSLLVSPTVAWTSSKTWAVGFFKR